MEKIRFGIVGIGMMGRMHATSLQRNPHAEVVAVCARTESKVKAFQEEFGVPYGYTDVDELVNNPEVDAIVVATAQMLTRHRVWQPARQEAYLLREAAVRIC